MIEHHFSNFRSAIEWPDARPYYEEPQRGGRLEHISKYAVAAVEYAGEAREIAPKCESAIETELGARLNMALRRINDATLTLVPQYKLGRYRYDFAITRQDRPKPIVLVECDGKEFHSTNDQIANDRVKDALAKSETIFLYRFTGSDIFRYGPACVAEIIKMMRFHGHLTQDQWDRTLESGGDFISF